jgi:hypothetical protein
LTFYPLKKVASPLIRVDKNFFKIGRTGGIKRSAEVLSLAKGEKILQKN